MSDSWNPVVEDVKRLDVPCLYALPKEGNRLWFYGVNVSSKAKDPELAYLYADWWLNGWAGAQVATQGYYSPVSSLVKEQLGELEFGYWYEGKETRIASPTSSARAVPASSGSAPSSPSTSGRKSSTTWFRSGPTSKHRSDGTGEAARATAGCRQSRCRHPGPDRRLAGAT